MNNNEPIKHFLNTRRQLMYLVVLLITLALTLGQSGLSPASAVWNQPPDPIDPDPIGSPGQFVPPADGFTWSVPARFGRDSNGDGLIDYHWNPVTMTYEQSYIYPQGWPMNFYGCQTSVDDANPYSTTNTYKWELDGKSFTGNKCLFSYDNPGFTTQGTYTVTLTVTDPSGAPVPAGKNRPYFQQQVYIKDYLIISIGDSFASGEGNPDIQQNAVPNTPFPGWHQVSPPVWEDKRCNRSAYAGPAQAAMDLEAADPHTSVTFISFACAGATINTPTYAPIYWQGLPPFINMDPDINKPQGSGILGKYIGLEPDNVAYGDYSKYIPSQMDQVQTAINPPTGKSARTIDSLIISGGGNDIHFGDIVKACLLTDNCWQNASVFDDPATGSFLLPALINYVLKPYPDGSPTSLPDDYAKLNTAINALSSKPAKVYITQYPDLTRDDNGGYCRMLDDVFWPLNYAITPDEAHTAADLALTGLNAAVQKAAHDYGWQYVDGLASYEVDPAKTAHTPGEFVKGPDGKGHGYCASDNWIRRADESELIQGPVNLRALTQGTVHPTIRGHQAYKERILYYMLPNLAAVPASTPPTFKTSYTSGGLTSTPGSNGWYTGSCAGTTCYPKVVFQTTAKGSTSLTGASVAVNGQAGCSVDGVICSTTTYTPTNEVKWDFSFTGDGIFRMQFSAKDANNQVATFGAEIKVDLHDPTFVTDPGPFSVNEGDSITLTAQATDSASGALNYDWDLDNDGTFETTDEQPTFSAASLDGPTSKTVGVRVTDEAGRSTTSTATVNVDNVAPTPVINDAPTTSPEGTAISLTSIVTDPGIADTFTYAWMVKKNGNSFANGSDPSFSFTPDDNGTYEVSLSVTDDDGGVGTAIETIIVTNVAPTVSNVKVDSGTINEGSSLTLTGNLTDPGTKDSFKLTINWGDGSSLESVSLKAGSTSFSQTHTYVDDNPTGTPADTNKIAVTVEDNDGGKGTGSASVIVNNLAPELSISAPVYGSLYAKDATVNLSASITDMGPSDTFTCSINWDDGITDNGTVASGGCTASHEYSAAGVFTIQMQVMDDDTGSDTDTVMVVVYDPSAGFVTGGGWIDSPAGAYTAEPTLMGKATFGFVSKYQKGATTPTGNTEFKFQAGNFKFDSDSYDWLVVAGAKAQFKGTGSVNGVSGYSFLLTATDGQVKGGGGVDKFRIKIWNATGVVYDNQLGSSDDIDTASTEAIGGGSIVIQSDK
jgi:hypothetical protein